MDSSYISLVTRTKYSLCHLSLMFSQCLFIMEQPFTFVHITDIHIERRAWDSSYIRFRDFVENVLPALDVSLVINTGDITNSVNSDKNRNRLAEGLMTRCARGG